MVDKLYHAAAPPGFQHQDFFAFQPGFIHQSQGNERAFSRSCRGTHNQGIFTAQMLPHLLDYFPYGKINMKWVEWQFFLAKLGFERTKNPFIQGIL